MLVTVEGSRQYTVAAYGAVAVQNISVNVPAGYKAIGAVGFTSGSAGVAVINVSVNRIDVQNVTNGNITATAKIEVLCTKKF